MVNHTVRVLAVAAAMLTSTAGVDVTKLGAQTAGNDTRGRTLYVKVGCETCHGPNGQETAAAPRIAGSGRELAAFIAYVRKPLGSMPPQSAQAVSDQVLADIYAFLRAAPAAGGEATKNAPAGRADAGATLYRKVGCYQCHVNEGQGGANGPRIGPDPIPFARFVQYVRSPTGQMPPYTDKVLSNQELADIYAWLQARPRPPAVNTLPPLAP
ncbi:MAG: cytochrome c [Acidobacteria bacterium]|nr:cytochrome c [Acidobacteriota bacterium]